MNGSKLKNHFVKHKSMYTAAGFLLVGIGVGFFVSRMADTRRAIVHVDDSSRDQKLMDNAVKYIEKSSAKIIGVFSEVDGAEYETFNELRKVNGIIGSTSADVGDVELYYDTDGTTYVVAHDFEEYYGKRPVAINPTGKKVYT